MLNTCELLYTNKTLPKEAVYRHVMSMIMYMYVHVCVFDRLNYLSIL